MVTVGEIINDMIIGLRMDIITIIIIIIIKKVGGISEVSEY